MYNEAELITPAKTHQGLDWGSDDLISGIFQTPAIGKKGRLCFLLKSLAKPRSHQVQALQRLDFSHLERQQLDCEAGNLWILIKPSKNVCPLGNVTKIQ